MAKSNSAKTIKEYIVNLSNGTENQKKFINNLETFYNNLPIVFKNKALDKSDDLKLPLRRALFHIHQIIHDTLGDPCIHFIMLSQHLISQIDNNKLTPTDDHNWEGFDSIKVAENYVKDWKLDVMPEGELRSFRCFTDFFSDRSSSFVVEVSESKQKIVSGADLKTQNFIIPHNYHKQTNLKETVWAFSACVKSLLTAKRITTFYVLGFGSHEKTWPDEKLIKGDTVNSIFIVFSGGTAKDKLNKAAGLLGSINGKLLQALHSDQKSLLEEKNALLELDVMKSREIERLLRTAEESFKETSTTLARLTNLTSGFANRMIRFADKFGSTLINGTNVSYKIDCKNQTLEGVSDHSFFGQAQDLSVTFSHAKLLLIDMVFLGVEDDFANILFNIDDMKGSLDNLKNNLCRVFRKANGSPDNDILYYTLNILTEGRIEYKDGDYDIELIKNDCNLGIWELFPNVRTFLPALLDIVICWAGKNSKIIISKQEDCTINPHLVHHTFTITPNNADSDRDWDISKLSRVLSELIKETSHTSNHQLGDLSTAVKAILMSANQHFIATVDVKSMERVELSWHGTVTKRNGFFLKSSLGFEKTKIDFSYPVIVNPDPLPTCPYPNDSERKSKCSILKTSDAD